MNLLFAVLILAAESSAPIDGSGAEAAIVFSCDFEAAADKNFDGWPDGWTRRQGKGFPEYVKAAIVADSSRGGGKCLRIELDGGAATLYSPPLPVSGAFSYLLEGKLRTERLKHHVAGCSVTFLDAEKRPLATHYSPQLTTVHDWKPTTVGPVTPGDKSVLAVIGLHLRPTARADITGAAFFDDLQLTRLPRFALELNAEHYIYHDKAKVEVTCRASGLVEREPIIEFELLDAAGRQLASAAKPLTLAKGLAPPAETEMSCSGEVVWNPPIPDWGFYRVRVRIAGRGEATLERSATLVVMRPLSTPRGGQFGWTLPRGERPLSLKSLAGLLAQSGISWVKFPVWYREDDVARADELAAFAERLGSLGIELIGMLDLPPAETRTQFGGGDQLPIASIFVEPAVWQPVVDPVMSRLGLKVRWWQLGADDDLSFVGYPGLDKKIAEIRKHLERFGQEIQVSLPWNASHEPPNTKEVPWSAISYRAEPSFTPQELAEHLSGIRSPGVKRWMILQPLSRSRYPVETRAQDLVGRMLAAKMERAEGVFVPDPFSAEHGLLNADGTPGELLLPWRTTAQMLAGAEYIGNIDLPGGSQNQLFSRDGQALLVVWNERPTSETLYLGDDLRQVDVWGREFKPRKIGHEQEVEVGVTPSFITGVNLFVAKWRLAFAFDKHELASVFGRDQQASFRFRNTFDQGVGGEISLATPSVWEVTPGKFYFKAASGEELTQKLTVLLRPDASTGDQQVRIDFDVAAERNYKFSVYPTLRVGLGDITVEMTTRLNEDGDLVVEQHLTNTTDKLVSFNCYLFLPERRRQRSQVFEQGRGRVTRIYVLPKGEELLGQTLWLRAEEINGPRILNGRVTVER